MAYQFIDPTECMGDSLFKINNNAANFDTRINSISTVVLKLEGVHFIPANLASKSNQDIILFNHGYTGTTTGNLNNNWPGAVRQTQLTNVKSLAETGTNQRAWWSGAKLISVSNVPSNTVGLLVSFNFNVNTQQNNSCRLYARRNSAESGHGWKSSGSGDLTQAELNSFSDNFLKVAIDPISTAQSTAPAGTGAATEGDNSSIAVVYPAGIGTTRTFEYCIVDVKSSTPRAIPQYNPRAVLLGYYVFV
jgi:hypothetical protein